jgi:hypothetical protein
MKIRTDFVSNSSSTSFIVISEDDFTKEEFFKLMGVVENSPLTPLFEALYNQLQNNMYSVFDYLLRYQKSLEDWQNIIKEDFGQEVLNRITDAENNKKKVFIGKLSSDESLMEAFFCTDSFELENDRIYLNALECSW